MTSTTAYKLTYFNLRGRGEIIRMVFAAAGVEYEDERIEMSDWPKVKPTIPGGRLPVLTVTVGDAEPTHYNESMAVARWLARKFKLMGETDEEYYRIERIIGECADLSKEFSKIFFAPNDEKERVTVEALAGPVPKMLDLLTHSLEDSDGKFVAGDQLTLGDLNLMVDLENVQSADENILKDKYPRLLAFREAVLESNKKLAAYIASRPETPF
ncbi:unnamed protein product [Calicophoron daubneyi]|uniref:Glutathione transferase n=1 Tax=Calicophoron daubneyi TaxID=300641 RepID=A0AAV2T940_CALDB